MIALTTARGEDCGAPGDLLNREEAECTLHSQAKVIEVDIEWEGPCRRESQVQVFTADFKYHKDCINLVTEERSNLPHMWLSVAVINETKKLEAVKTIMRDCYTAHAVK